MRLDENEVKEILGISNKEPCSLCSNENWKIYHNEGCPKENRMSDKIALEIIDDPTNLRTILQKVIDVLRGPNGKASSREKALAVTKLQEAKFWLGEDMFHNVN